MRRCNVCGETKSINEFGANKTQPLGKSYMCKECRRAYDKKKYREKPEIYKERHYKHKKKMYAINRAIIWERLSSSECKDCPESDPLVLQFDHTEDNKKYNIGAMVGNTYSTETLVAEMDKCEIVCANCHIKRTSKRGNWWRNEMT